MKIKRNHVFLATLTAATLLLASCSLFHGPDSSSSSSTGVTTDRPTITLSVATDSRTALPTVNDEYYRTGITRYTLKGTKAGSATETDENSKVWTYGDEGTQTTSDAGIIWATDTDGTAYEKMSSDKITLSAGTWSFTLKAEAINGETTIASYVGENTTVIKNTSESTELKFKLMLASLGAVEGETGVLTITINFTDESETAQSAKTLTGTLYRSGESGEELVSVLSSGTGAGRTWSVCESSRAGAVTVLPIATATADSYIQAGVYTYRLNAVPAGAYKAVFTFADDNGATLATLPEAVYINSLNASSTIEIANLDAAYTVTYYSQLNMGEVTAYDETYGTADVSSRTYSRIDSFDLPTVTANSGYSFWRWVEVTESTTTEPSAVPTKVVGTTAITAHPTNRIGNRSYCAQFFDEEVMRQLSKVEITGEEKVGNTLTATAYYKDDTEQDVPFKSKLAYTWWYGTPDTTGAVETWTAIPGAGSTVVLGSSTQHDVMITKDEDGVYTSQLVVRPAYYGKKLRVTAMQEYTVTTDETSGEVTVAKKTDIADYVYTEHEYAITENTIAKGKLALSTTAGYEFAMSYPTPAMADEDTSTHTTVIGDPLVIKRFTVTKGAVQDAVSTTWEYATTARFGTSGTEDFVTEETPLAVPEASETTPWNSPASYAVALSCDTVAPKSSGATPLTLTFSVYGYEDLVLSDTSSELEGSDTRLTVEIPVKAKAPVATLPATIGEGEGKKYATAAAYNAAEDQLYLYFADTNVVTKGKIRFATVAAATSPAVTEAHAVPALEYSFDPTAETPVWEDWHTTAADTPYTKAEIAIPSGTPAPAAVYVRTKATDADVPTNPLDEPAYGEIEASDYVEIALVDEDDTELARNVGTLVRLDRATYTYSTVTRSENDKIASVDPTVKVNNDKVQVGTAITVNALPAVEGDAITATKLVYTWEAGSGDSWEEVQKSVHDAPPSDADADRIASFYKDTFNFRSSYLELYPDYCNIGKELRVTITPTYPEGTETTADSAYMLSVLEHDENAEATNDCVVSETIALGTLDVSGVSLTYAGDVKEPVGAKPVLSRVSLAAGSGDNHVIITNALSEAVLVSAETLNAVDVAATVGSLAGIAASFDDSTTVTPATEAIEGAPFYGTDSTVLVPVRFTAEGYNPAIVTVAVPVKPNAELAAELLYGTAELPNIPQGCVKVKAVDYYKYEFKMASGTGFVWAPLPETNTAFNTSGAIYTGEGFTDYLTVRFKKTATVGDTIYYYNSGTVVGEEESTGGIWVTSEGVEATTDVIEAISALTSEKISTVSAEILVPLTEEKGAGAGVNYIGGHAAQVSVSINNDSDLVLIPTYSETNTRTCTLSLINDEDIFGVSGSDEYKTVRNSIKWYKDDELEDAYSGSETYQVVLPSTIKVGTGKIIVRVEVTSKLGDILTSTATITLTK